MPSLFSGGGATATHLISSLVVTALTRDVGDLGQRSPLYQRGRKDLISQLSEECMIHRPKGFTNVRAPSVFPVEAIPLWLNNESMTGAEEIGLGSPTFQVGALATKL